MSNLSNLANQQFLSVPIHSTATPYPPKGGIHPQKNILSMTYLGWISEALTSPSGDLGVSVGNKNYCQSLQLACREFGKIVN
ncbi:MAG: hypothetical protein HKN16_11215 [Saprospiraceae bacterium]|nr:hypothetical protein [Saprospiraceae bacterium]